ncbi:VOC family protein, partial [Variovorax sp. 2RAF20]
MLTGLNHLTLAVSNLARSLNFYTETRGFIPKAAWDHGAYLSLGELWL